MPVDATARRPRNGVMQLYSDLSQVSHDLPDSAATAATIGVFDGLHRGHQALIGRAVKAARAGGLSALVITFQEHPLSLLAPPYCPKRLLDRDRKHLLIQNMGVDLLADIPFNEQFARTSPEEFVQGVLAKQCRVQHLVCGYDFTFGHTGAGKVEHLRRWAPEAGIALEVVEPVADHGICVKSTTIRDCLLTGDVERAASLLTRPYDLSGTVRKGFSRGRKLGFPTANLPIPEGRIIPARGVYLAAATIEDSNESSTVYGAMVNIGFNPTFQGEQLSIEAHLLNFEGDLSARPLRLHFLRRLRDEQKFSGPEALVEQLRCDREQSLQMLQQQEIFALINAAVS